MKYRLNTMIATLLALLTVIGTVACTTSDGPAAQTTNTVGTSTSTVKTGGDGRSHDNLPETDWENADFLIWTYDNSNMMCPTLNEDASQSTDAVSEAMYKAALEVEERFHINLEEILINDRDISIYSNPARAGSYEYDVANARCIYVVPLWSENLLYTFDQIPYVDLDREYWNQSANDSLSINNVQYAAIGGYSVAAYSLVHALLFNKNLISNLSLDNPYDLVKEKNWTFDTMNAMMVEAIKDLDGNSVMDGEDRYGYLAHYKEVLPSFWLAADTFSVGKDEEDIPFSNLAGEKFNAVFNKVFEMLHDTGVWYNGNGETWNLDIPDFCIEMFGAGQALFMDTTFHAMSRMRNISNIEYGILPYPKWDVNQAEYRSRVEYYNSQVVPSGVGNPDRTGMILEALNCAYYNEFLPAYYEVALQRKYTIDDESAEMLDIVFNTLVIDIGDTTLCDKVRDGIFMSMFQKNNRNLASIAARCNTLINNALKDFYA